MAILEQVKLEQTAPVNSSRRPFAGFAVDRPRAKVWANWSIILGGEMVPLPLGQAIDTMEPASTTGQNADVVRRNHAKNRALAAFQALGAKMAPGETMVIGNAEHEGNIVCHLRRVSDELELVKTESDLDVDGIVALLSPKVETPKVDTKAAMQVQLEALQKALAGE